MCKSVLVVAGTPRGIEVLIDWHCPNEMGSLRSAANKYSILGLIMKIFSNPLCLDYHSPGHPECPQAGSGDS